MPRQAQAPWYPSQRTSVANGHDDFRCERTRRKQYAPPRRGIKIVRIFPVPWTATSDTGDRTRENLEYNMSRQVLGHTPDQRVAVSTSRRYSVGLQKEFWMYRLELSIPTDPIWPMVINNKEIAKCHKIELSMTFDSPIL